MVSGSDGQAVWGRRIRATRDALAVLVADAYDRHMDVGGVREE